MNWLHFIIDYLLLANVVTFIAYGIDKYKAKKGNGAFRRRHSC